MRVSTTVERSLSNCFARIVFTAYKKQHILHFCCWKSCVQLRWHCKVYQGVQAYGSICRQPGSGRASTECYSRGERFRQAANDLCNKFLRKGRVGGLILERGIISSGYFSKKAYWQLFSSIIREVSISFDIISMFWSPGLCSYDWSSPFTAWVLNRILHSLSLKSYLTEELTARSGFLSGYINSDHKCQKKDAATLLHHPYFSVIVITIHTPQNSPQTNQPITPDKFKYAKQFINDLRYCLETCAMHTCTNISNYS